MHKKVLAAASVCLILSGCNATSNTSYRYKGLATDDSSAVLIDAKQRSILSQAVELTDGDPEEIRRFCAEPSPDFVSVMAQSLAAGGTFGKSADPATLQIAANLAYSSSENGTTIARTQTINMLRELMYRTCERYLSGGYDESELSVQAVRDQRLMVSILAIEQLTGAVAPSPVVIQSDSSASAGLSGEAIQTFAKLRDEKNKADADAASASKAYQDTMGNGDDGKPRECQAIKDALAQDPNATVDADTKKECDTLKKNADDAAAVAKETNDAYSTVKKAMDTGGVSTSTVSDAIAKGGISRASTGETKEVADTVEEIVKLNFNDQTETMLFCMRILEEGFEKAKDAGTVTYSTAGDDGIMVDKTVNPYHQLIVRCTLFFDAKIGQDTLTVQQIQTRADVNAAQERKAFDAVWSNISKNGVVDAGLMDALLVKAKVPNNADGLAEFKSMYGKDQNQAWAIFATLDGAFKDIVFNAKGAS